jgi:hypothetical protein
MPMSRPPRCRTACAYGCYRAPRPIEQLAETWPAAFSVYEERRRPLRVGIREDILAVLEIDPRELGLALGIYCRNRA